MYIYFFPTQNLQGLTGTPLVAGSPIRHEGSLQCNPVEVQTFQPPWKALSEFALQSDLDQPAFQQLVSVSLSSVYLFRLSFSIPRALSFNVSSSPVHPFFQMFSLTLSCSRRLSFLSPSLFLSSIPLPLPLLSLPLPLSPFSPSHSLSLIPLPPLTTCSPCVYKVVE